jgi:hypothetical protein
MDPAKVAALDQGMAVLIEYLPTMWRRLYVRLIEEGFKEAEAMELVKTYIFATCKTQA